MRGPRFATSARTRRQVPLTPQPRSRDEPGRSSPRTPVVRLYQGYAPCPAAGGRGRRGKPKRGVMRRPRSARRVPSFVRSFRAPTFESAGLLAVEEACAGMIDDGDPDATVRREAEEE